MIDSQNHFAILMKRTILTLTFTFTFTFRTINCRKEQKEEKTATEKCCRVWFNGFTFVTRSKCFKLNQFEISLNICDKIVLRFILSNKNFKFKKLIEFKSHDLMTRLIWAKIMWATWLINCLIEILSWINGNRWMFFYRIPRNSD